MLPVINGGQYEQQPVQKNQFLEERKKTTSIIHKNESIYQEEQSFCTQASFVVTKERDPFLRYCNYIEMRPRALKDNQCPFSEGTEMLAHSEKVKITKKINTKYGKDQGFRNKCITISGRRLVNSSRKCNNENTLGLCSWETSNGL